MSDDRNFRSTYYGKVGFKVIEEKKSLEIILKEDPIDTIKLSQFCLKFPVPCAYRYLIWQVLLGVLPCHQSTFELAYEQRKGQFQDLKNAVVIMRKVDAKTPTELVYLKMYLIEEKNLPYDSSDNRLIEEHSNFFLIARIMAEQVTDEVRAFWLATKLTSFLENNLTNDVRVLVADIETILFREDGELCDFVRKQMLLDILPLQSLFLSAFASFFPEEVLERIWDRVIGGSVGYLSYVFVATLLVMKRQILGSNDINQVLNDLSVDQSDLIVSMAMELWMKDGCPLQITRN